MMIYQFTKKLLKTSEKIFVSFRKRIENENSHEC